MRSRPKLIPKEDDEQIALMRWAKLHPICKDYLIAIPNGGSRNLYEAVKLKRMGVKRGVSDLFLAYPLKGKAGLWIELKRLDDKISKPTKQQIEWLTRMKDVGYQVCIAYGWEDAKEMIDFYLKKTSFSSIAISDDINIGNDEFFNNRFSKYAINE